jgi:hypothetical protein
MFKHLLRYQKGQSIPKRKKIMQCDKNSLRYLKNLKILFLFSHGGIGVKFRLNVDRYLGNTLPFKTNTNDVASFECISEIQIFTIRRFWTCKAPSINYVTTKKSRTLPPPWPTVTIFKIPRPPPPPTTTFIYSTWPTVTIFKIPSPLPTWSRSLWTAPKTLCSSILIC